MKCTKNQRPRIRRCNLTWEDRKRIAKVWNVPDGHKHLSIREAAKILHMPESSLRYELKRGCANGQVCMKLRDKKKVRYQYFPYSPDSAQENAIHCGAQKGPRQKMTTAIVADFLAKLAEWTSIAAARHCLAEEAADGQYVPSRTTFYNYAREGLIPTVINGKQRYRRLGSRKRYVHPKPARNHTPEHRYADLPEAAKKGLETGHWQLDTIVSCREGHGALVVMIDRVDNHRAYVRVVKRNTRKDVYRAIRSIVKEATADGAKMKTILTDNDIVFIDAPKLHAITGATIYYTDAYAGWQKGNVENCNKIIRRRHDKGTDFSKMSKREERHTQWWINNYPRPTDIKKKATTMV